MTLVKIETWRVEMPLRQPYTIAYETFDGAVNLFVRLTDSQGLGGVGCAAPAPEVTGETAEESHEALRMAAAELIRDPPSFDLFPPTLPATPAAHHPAARAAIEMAAYDLAARARGEPVWSCLGGTRRPLPTSITLGIAPLEEVLEQAHAHARAGFQALKLKGGAALEEDIGRTLALRRELGPDIELRFDANQGYSIEDTVRFAGATADAGLSMIEQPVRGPANDRWLELSRRLASEVPAPVPLLMADESLLGPSDARRLAAGSAVQAFNVKLMKCGGIAAALEIAEIAQSAGIPIMLSCMDEGAVSIAAALHLTLASPTVRWIDLDGHLDLIDDPSAGAVCLEAGSLRPAPSPGLGAALAL